MRFLRLVARVCTDFLFPQEKRAIALEELSASEIVDSMPAPEFIKDEHTIALFSYSHPLMRELIWELKYNGNKIVADKLGEILADTITNELAEREVFDNFKRPILIPVPISDKRRLERGWNQSELLAQAIKKRDTEEKLKYMPRQLVKVRHTESQTKTSNKEERQSNLKNSMKVLSPHSVQGRSVILIDDVITTGSTFKEARRALKEVGVRHVLCIAVAH